MLTEYLSEHQNTDAAIDRFLKVCAVKEVLPEHVARNAGWLRDQTGRDISCGCCRRCQVEPDGVVLSTDLKDLNALAAHERSVAVE